MRILGIDTATKTCGVAVTEGEMLRGMLSLHSHISHSHHLLSCIHHLLVSLCLSLEDLDGFAITQGPGSFTGLRIGMATLEGLMIGVPRPVLGINTLEAIAMQFFPTPYPVCSLLDARKGEVYAAFFTGDRGEMRRCTEDMAISPSALCARIKEPTLLVGEGAVVYRDFFVSSLHEKCLLSRRGLGTSCADMVALLAQERFTQKQERMRAPFTLHYVRPSEAELHEMGTRSSNRGDHTMKDVDPTLIEQVKKENEEFSRLLKEHQEYEEQLDAFNKLRYLTSEQEIEKKQIQKRKLLVKDRMAEILRQYSSAE